MTMRLSELIRRAIDARLAEVRVALPGKVDAYDVSTQTVDVQPLIKNVIDAEDGKAVESLPVIPSVPVCFPRGGGCFITMPLAAGDTGLLVVCDRSIDQWHKLGGEVDPRDLRMHSLGSAVFYPGLWDETQAMTEAHADNLVLGVEGGSHIHIKPSGEIHLGSESAADFVALAAAVKAEIQALRDTVNSNTTIFNAHLHPGVLAGPASSGPTATPQTPPAAVGEVKASKVKAD